MSENNHEGMKRCTKCGEWKPATAEYFDRDKTGKDRLRARCKDCAREYRQKNKDRILEYDREYKHKNKDRLREYKREYKQSPVGRFSISIGCLRQKTGATIYLRDMAEEQKETLANQYIAIRTLEKTEKELLSASGKKRCPRCDRVLDYGCFNKDSRRSDGVRSWCRECAAEHDRKYRQKNREEIAERQREYHEKNKEEIAERRREYYQKNKDHYREYRQKNREEIAERKREYYQKNKDKIAELQRKYRQNKKALDKTKSIPDNRE